MFFYFSVAFQDYRVASATEAKHAFFFINRVSQLSCASHVSGAWWPDTVAGVATCNYNRCNMKCFAHIRVLLIVCPSAALFHDRTADCLDQWNTPVSSLVNVKQNCIFCKFCSNPSFFLSFFLSRYDARMNTLWFNNWLSKNGSKQTWYSTQEHI